MATEVEVTDSVLAREREFYDHTAPTVEDVLAAVRFGPETPGDPSESPAGTMLAAVGPLAGKRVLDFACGAGVTSLWLASAGADVVAVDLSPTSIAVGREAAKRLQLDVDFRVVDGVEDDFAGPYDAIIGQFALHHVDVRATATRLAASLKPGGVAAFVETTADNPILRWARRNLPGRFGVVRIGTPDEHPLTHADRATLGEIFGDLKVVTPWYQLLWLFDRHVLRFRWKRIQPLINRIDRRLGRIDAISDWGYTKVFIATKTPTPEATEHLAAVHG
jgi:SAM-dependent methyltransferase